MTGYCKNCGDQVCSCVFYSDEMEQVSVPFDTMQEGVIAFDCDANKSGHPLLALGPKDEIRVRGKLIERDYEVVEALRYFVKHGNLTMPKEG